MSRGELIALVALAFAIFAALVGMLLSLVIDAHQTTRKNAEDILKLEKQIMELRYTSQPILPVSLPPGDLRPRSKGRHRQRHSLGHRPR